MEIRIIKVLLYLFCSDYEYIHILHDNSVVTYSPNDSAGFGLLGPSRSLTVIKKTTMQYGKIIIT